MAKYDGGCTSAYLETLMAEFFRNSLRFFRDHVSDDDYFDPIRKMIDARGLEQKIYDRIPSDDLVAMELAWYCKKERREPRNGRKYGKPELAFINDVVTETLRCLWNERSTFETCRTLLIEIVDGYLAEKKDLAGQDELKSRFDELGKFFKLSELDLAMLKLAFVRSGTVFSNDPFSGRRGSTLKNERMKFYAMCIDRSVAEVRALCGRTSALRKYDFVDEDLDINEAVQEFLNGEEQEPLQGRFYRRAEPEEVLPWSFYSKTIRHHGEILKRLVRSRRPGTGVNILLYGEPGTGKTSLAMTLAKDLGLEAYEVMHGESDGKNTSLGSRLIGVQVCNEQMPKGTGLMVVDEADQILQTSGGGFMGFFGGGVARASEKGQVNAMLDAIKVPTVWISNASADTMDDSVRRRFDYSICFHKLTHEMRVNIWKNNIRKLRLGKLIPAAVVEELATKYETSAGGISMVLKNLKAMEPSAAEVPELVRELMEPHCELMGARTADDVLSPAKDYSLEGLNLKGDVDLADITGAVRNFLADDAGRGLDRPRMNLLLWGPPGTGKTEYVKYLAKKLNRPVTVKMGSDLLSMWVGGTEKNIRNAFREAEESGSILFLDEIDGLVRDRAGASRNWEVTQVNELLYQMENFKGVLIAATNFMDNLDQAVLRRFTFKLQFDFLDEDGKHLFFERMFETRLSPEDAAALTEVRNLTPGDFRTVRQSLYYLGGGVTNAQRIAALAKESAVKRDTKAPARIGF